MKHYALLTILYGTSNSMGKVREIRFRFPPQEGNEKNIFNDAIGVIEKYNFQTNYYWSLVDKENHLKFCETIQTLLPDSEIIKKPTLIMHGLIDFEVCLKLNGFQLADREQLLDTILIKNIPLNKNSYHSSFSMKKEIDTMFGIKPTEAELQEEKRAVFLENLEFYTDKGN